MSCERRWKVTDFVQFSGEDTSYLVPPWTLHTVRHYVRWSPIPVLRLLDPSFFYLNM